VGLATARPTETGVCVLRFRGRRKVRSIHPVAAITLAAWLTFPTPVPAQQGAKSYVPVPVQAKRTVPIVAQAGGHAAFTEKLNQNTVTVISGNPNGAYLYLAFDMSAVLDSGSDLRVLPVIGKGGYQNMMDVLYLKGVDLGITQSNIMGYLKKTGEFGPNIEGRVAYIAKLYNEEMHILAGPGISSVQELHGKRVNLSDIGSGTQFSSRLIFELMGIKVQEVNFDQSEGYQRVKSGDIAATVLIAGKPTGAFGKFKLEPGMTLLPMPYTDVLEQDYFPAKLTNDDYPNLIPKGSSVDTVAVGAVLVAFNWPRNTDRYRRVAAFVDAFFAKFPDFQKPARHSKWKEANLNSTLRGWKRFPAAEEWLARNSERQTVAGGVQVDPTIARTQAAKAAPNDPAEQERLFQQFMEWAKSQKR
jgi:TRAP transporter TAXI family solute receptor